MSDLPDGGHGDDNPVERSGNVRVSRIRILDNWQDCFLCFLLKKISVYTLHPKKYLFNVEAEAGEDQARHPYRQ